MEGFATHPPGIMTADGLWVLDTHTKDCCGGVIRGQIFFIYITAIYLSHQPPAASLVAGVVGNYGSRCIGQTNQHAVIWSDHITPPSPSRPTLATPLSIAMRTPIKMSRSKLTPWKRDWPCPKPTNSPSSSSSKQPFSRSSCSEHLS